jgi:uncharacterized protein YkwD
MTKTFIKDGISKLIATALAGTLAVSGMAGAPMIADTAYAAGTSSAAQSAQSGLTITADSVVMLRLYNPNTGEHLYTSDSNEALELVRIGWKNEGVGWIAPKSGDEVYRLYNPNTSDHHYTLDANEKKELVKIGWKYEGVGWYSDKNKAVALYRQFNPNEKVGTHNYTTDKNENDSLVKKGWKGEGTAWYALSAGDTTAVQDFYKDFAKKILDLVNAERKSAGLAALEWDEESYRYTAGRAKTISAKFSHDGVASGFGENIAMTSWALYSKDMASDFYTIWKNSAGHHSNYMNANYTKASMAIYIDDKGAGYAVQSFLR